MWIRALPGSPAESLLGEHATPEAVAQIRHQYGLDEPVYVQYWDYLKTIGSGNLGTSIASTRTITVRARAPFPGDDRAGFRGDDLRDLPSAFRSASSRRRGTGRASTTPASCGFADRDLDPDLLPRDHPQVHLLRAARLAPEHRPRGHAQRGDAPDELLRPRRDHHRQPRGVLGRDQAPDPSRDRARVDPAGDHLAHHPRIGARRPERGLRAHGPRQGAGAAHASTAAT